VGKGTSPLQEAILDILDERTGWSRPKDILEALGREPTPTNRTAISKALTRLWVRKLVEQSTGEVVQVGKSRLYRKARTRPQPR
jgi:hypothetical protein